MYFSTNIFQMTSARVDKWDGKRRDVSREKYRMQRDVKEKHSNVMEEENILRSDEKRKLNDKREISQVS
jgi:hypothetical protein